MSKTVAFDSMRDAIAALDALGLREGRKIISAARLSRRCATMSKLMWSA